MELSRQLLGLLMELGESGKPTQREKRKMEIQAHINRHAEVVRVFREPRKHLARPLITGEAVQERPLGVCLGARYA